MKLGKLIEELNKVYPESIKMDFDNVGLMVGDKEKDIESVLLALDLTQEVLNEAINNKVNLIITHHPLIFNPLKSIDRSTDIGSIIYSLIKNDIAVYSMHTNFDVVKMNDYLSDLLNITNKEVLSIRDNCGVIGDIEKTNIDEFINKVKETFDINEALYYGKSGIDIKRVAIVGGSGSSYYLDAYYKGADLFITGDVSYSRGLESKRLGLNILDVGHFIEKKFVYPVMKTINEIDNNIYILLSQIDVKPYKLY